MSGFGGNRIKPFLVVMKIKRAQIFVSFLLKMFSVQGNKMESSPCSYFPFSFFNSREETHQTREHQKNRISIRLFWHQQIFGRLVEQLNCR